MYIKIDAVRRHSKNGQPMMMRLARPGDERGIARLLVLSFPIYQAAARGDIGQAIDCLAKELSCFPGRLEQTAIAVLEPAGSIIGAGVFVLSDSAPRTGLALRKFKIWGLYGLTRFAIARAVAMLTEPDIVVGPGEMYKALAAVDPNYQSDGVWTLISEFLEDVAVANNVQTTWSVHSADNAVMLAIQRKRGCVLQPVPQRLLGKLMRQPRTIRSTKCLNRVSTY